MDLPTEIVRKWKKIKVLFDPLFKIVFISIFSPIEDLIQCLYFYYLNRQICRVYRVLFCLKIGDKPSVSLCMWINCPHNIDNEDNLLHFIFIFLFLILVRLPFTKCNFIFFDLTGNYTKPKVYFYFYFYLTGFFVLLKSVIQLIKLEQPKQQ